MSKHKVVVDLTPIFVTRIIPRLLQLNLEHHRCSHCGSDNIEIEASFSLMMKVRYIMHCLECGHKELLLEEVIEDD